MNRFQIALILLLLPTIASAADDPLVEIGRHLRAGQLVEARPKIVKLRDDSIARSDADGEGTAWLLLAMIDSMLRNPPAVREDLNTAATKFAATRDSFGGWMALYMLAQHEKGEGRFQEALAVHERIGALVANAASPNARMSLGVFKILGTVTGMAPGGLDMIGQYEEFMKPLLLVFVEVMSRDEHACVLLEMGELEKADEELNKASAAVGPFAMLWGPAFDGTIEAHRGTLRLRQWRLDEARAHYNKALAGAQAAPRLWVGSDWVELEIMRKLSNLEVLSGRTEEGLAWNDRAVRLTREAKNPKKEAEVLEERGTLLQNAGRMAAADVAFQDALKLATANKDTFRIAMIHSDIGAMRMFEGLYGSSLEHLEKAIELLQTLNEPYLEAPIWSLLAEVYWVLESNDTAQAALDRSRALAKKSGFRLAEAMVDVLASAKKHQAGEATLEEIDAASHAFFALPEMKTLMFTSEARRVFRAALTVGNEDMTAVEPDQTATAGPPIFHAMALMYKGMSLLNRGRYAEARALFDRSGQSNPSADHQAGLAALIGASYWREGRRNEAVAHFRKAAEVLDTTAVNVKVEDLLTSYLGGDRRWYFSLLVEMLIQEGHTQEAFAQAERARARAFLQLVGNHRLNAERGGDPALLREAEALRTHIAEREREAKNEYGDKAKTIAADLALERQRYQIVMTRVKVSNQEYASLTNVEPLSIESVQKELPPDATLISYFVSPNVVHAWTVSATDAFHTTLPVDQTRLQRVVCWASQFRPPEGIRGVLPPGTQCTEAATAEEAFDGLIGPLLTGIRTEKLILVPHGVLHYVPFAALRNRTTGQYLIEKYTLTYAPSASTLRFLRSKESPIEGGALVLGNPASPLPLRKLPFAQQEAIAIAQRLHTEAHVAEEARESLLYGIGGKFDLIHLAAHGMYDPANPIFSRIALAPGDGHDGSLTVHEILSSVDLTGVNLVVLSACRSAVGARSGGDEVVGLTRALLYAGTPGVLSTLWNIDDAASAGLMDEFYRCLGEGKTAAAALREAQLEVMRSEQHSHPKYWAAFQLNGDPQATWKTRRAGN